MNDEPNPTVEAAVREIWEYTRENCLSLDSHEQTAILRKMVWQALRNASPAIAELEQKLEEANREISGLRQRCKRRSRKKA